MEAKPDKNGEQMAGEQTNPPEIVVNGDSVPETSTGHVALEPILKGGGGFCSTGLIAIVVVAVAGLVIVGAGVGTYLAVDRMNSWDSGQFYAKIIFYFCQISL